MNKSSVCLFTLKETGRVTPSFPDQCNLHTSDSFREIDFFLKNIFWGFIPSYVCVDGGVGGGRKGGLVKLFLEALMP